MDIFGCCHLYTECSDAGKCLKLDNPVVYGGCQYKRNLQRGIIFYGKNAFKHLQKSNPVPEAPKTNEVYLRCYKRLFSIKASKRNSKCCFSYDLKADQAEQLRTLFDNLSVPYADQLIRDECLPDGPDQWCPDPANSRVIIEVAGQEFNILNYNNYLIKERYAIKITEAFKAKGIPARYEIFGSVNNMKGSIDSIMKKPKPVRPVQYEQIAIAL